MDTLIPARINNHIYSKLWGEIIYPLQNFNISTHEVMKTKYFHTTLHNIESFIHFMSKATLCW